MNNSTSILLHPYIFFTSRVFNFKSPIMRHREYKLSFAIAASTDTNTPAKSAVHATEYSEDTQIVKLLSYNNHTIPLLFEYNMTCKTKENFKVKWL